MPIPETRKRDLPFVSGQYTLATSHSSGYYQKDAFDASITGRQTTTSENHPEFFKLKRMKRRIRRDANSQTSETTLQNVGGDTGGPFHTQKHEYWTSHPDFVHLSVKDWLTFQYDYYGPLAAMHHSQGPTSPFWPSVSQYDENSLRAAGATAISIVSPLSPQVSAAQALGELKNDGLPSLPGLALFQAFLRRERRVGAIGAEFLNIMFGWKPAISDMRKLAETMKNSSELIQQLRRDSGRNIIRHFDFPTVTSETTEQVGGTTSLSTSPALRPDFWSSMSGIRTLTRSTETKIWFTGCFSYLLDPGNSAVERAIYQARIANYLYGLVITPETIWELTPWSWAIDWFTNTGDVIKNLSNWAISGQTLRWGYVMREERVTHTYTLSGPTLKGSAPVPFIQKFTTVDKRRIKASPYGFQLEWDGLSNTQLAILAALGISRSGL